MLERMDRADSRLGRGLALKVEVDVVLEVGRERVGF